ncbi:MAG: 7-cyano-7-deazaguanine synthase QueC [Planctomycetes bacterium]|nr:7-cyano-7-deazaguanine synthase QueC [Planctomycetota bacterium]
MAKTHKAVALLSGGLDSAVSIAIALAEEIKIPLALTFDYGQKSAPAEIHSSRKLCALWKIPHRAIKLDWFKDIAKGSALINPSKPIPQLKASDLNNLTKLKRTAQAVWAPNRNGLFINIAATFAESLKADYIITGFNREEAVTFPDNSPGFIKAINRALSLGTINKVKVVSFTINMDKAMIYRKGCELGIPLGFTWSCYKNGKRPCGKCESCLRLARARSH